MRIYILSDTAAQHTRRWVLWFANQGHEVHVVSFNPDGLSGYEPAIVHTLWEPKLNNSWFERVLKTPLIIKRLRSLFNKHPPDVVHAHTASGYAWVAMLSFFRPYVVTPWGTDLLVDIKKSKVNYWLTKLSLKKASLVTTDGFHFVDILHKLGVNNSKILVHRFGTDVNHYSPGDDNGEASKLALSKDPVVISTRTLHPVHNVEVFIKAIPLVHQVIPKAQYIVVADGSEREHLEALIEGFGLASLVRFTGMVEEDRLSNLLRLSDVYVSTSLMDAGLAGSTAEAMATCLPVVQTNNSDNSYWTPEGQGGYLVPDSDPEALSRAIISLLQNPATSEKMGINNRNKILAENNVDIELRKIEDEYRKLMNNK